MSDCGDCKIGFTGKDPAKRVKQLQTGASEELRLVKSFETSNAFMMERMLHVYFGSKRKKGEWFELDAADISEFGALCEKFETNIIALRDNAYIKKRYGND